MKIASRATPEGLVGHGLSTTDVNSATTISTREAKQGFSSRYWTNIGLGYEN